MRHIWFELTQSPANSPQGPGRPPGCSERMYDKTIVSQSLGKRAGKDAGRGKLTYPGLVGVEAARDKAQQLIETARDQAAVFGTSGWRLTWLADFVLERTH